MCGAAHAVRPVKGSSTSRRSRGSAWRGAWPSAAPGPPGQAGRCAGPMELQPRPQAWRRACTHVAAGLPSHPGVAAHGVLLRWAWRATRRALVLRCLSVVPPPAAGGGVLASHSGSWHVAAACLW